MKSFLMPADTSIESPELIQLNVEKDVGTSSVVPSPRPESLPERYCVPLMIHLIINPFAISNKIPFVHM